MILKKFFLQFLSVCLLLSIRCFNSFAGEEAKTAITTETEIFESANLAESADKPQESAYKIQKEDKLTIRVAEQEELNGAYTVFTDGMLEFPFIPDGVKAEGLTYNELAGAIKKRLEKEYFYHATVTVSKHRKGDLYVTSERVKKGLVYVYGMVSSPGVVTIPEDDVLTVSKVIIRCGGFQDFANKTKVRLFRKSPVTGKVEKKTYNLVNIIDKGKLDEDEVVQDGDMIVIPEQFFNF